MSNTFDNVTPNDSDSRYKKLKETFKEEIKKRFTCEDYDPIVDFVFNFVFVSKNTKENSIKEMKELFYDKSDEIISFLWSLTEKIYAPFTLTPKENIVTNDNDLLEEIYKDKNDNPKKFPSQIINPNAALVDESKSSKPISNSAIDRVRDDNRPNYRERYDRNDRNRFKPRDNYEYRRYDDERGGRRRDDFSRTMQVGDKKVVLRRKTSDRSRSGSAERKERERSRDDKGDKQEEGNFEERRNYDDRNRNYDRERDQHAQPYDNRNYYPQDNFFNTQRGFYPVRRFAARGGRFGRFLKAPRFEDPRRPMIRKSLMPRVAIGLPRTDSNEGGNDQIVNNTSIPQVNQIQEPMNVEGEQQHQQQQILEPRVVNPSQFQGHAHSHYQPHGYVHEEKSAEAKKKIRCKKWPSCKIEGCEWAHPKETCPYFPKCMFSEKCLYIHPNIPCKFGFYCTRLGCAYSHPVGYNPGMGMMPNLQRNWGGQGQFKNMRMDSNKSKPWTKTDPNVLPNESQNIVEHEQTQQTQHIQQTEQTEQMQ